MHAVPLPSKHALHPDAQALDAGHLLLGPRSRQGAGLILPAVGYGQ